ncbi:MAG TPA: hypothetical protein VFU49_01855 [Ktedonobacteraceae bacterium]|nr:hypothetical protein [Ktedonobacteraceae bacterium]
MMTTTQVFSLAEVARSLEFKPGFLVTRLHGRLFLGKFAEVLCALTPDQGLLVDGTGVEILDASFADEVFGAVAAQRSEPAWKGRCFALAHLSQDNIANVAAALDSRAMHESGLRNCVVPVLEAGEKGVLIGKAEGHVQESFALLHHQQQMTARELAEALALDIHAASTRLKILFDLGLVTRQEMRDANGKQFVYAWPF